MIKQIGLILFAFGFWHGVTVHEASAQKKKPKAKPAAKPKDDAVDPPADRSELPLGARDMLDNEIPRIREQERREAEKRRKAAREGRPADDAQKDEQPGEKKGDGKTTNGNKSTPKSESSRSRDGIIGGVPNGGEAAGVNASETVLRGNAINRATPDYPEIARQTKVTGDVVVEIVIDEQGQVIEARVVSGPALLQQAAVSAARRWTFHPTKLDGQPVKVRGAITFRFNLGN